VKKKKVITIVKVIHFHSSQSLRTQLNRKWLWGRLTLFVEKILIKISTVPYRKDGEIRNQNLRVSMNWQLKPSNCSFLFLHVSYDMSLQKSRYRNNKKKGKYNISRFFVDLTDQFLRLISSHIKINHIGSTGLPAPPEKNIC